jgi:hypothetical protein
MWVMTDFSRYVGVKLAEELSGDDLARAISDLASTAFPLVERESRLEKRIHLAIVKLVCDPWTSSRPEPQPDAKFQSALGLAEADWRDVLVAAGLEHDNWPEVLEAAGYEVPRLGKRVQSEAGNKRGGS